jgi:hypothetical protein
MQQRNANESFCRLLSMSGSLFNFHACRETAQKLTLHNANDTAFNGKHHHTNTGFDL